MIDFSMDLSKKLTNYDALQQKIRIRLGMHKRTIPYCDLGIEPFLFTYEDGSSAIIDALSDLNLGNIQYDSKNSRVKTLDVSININGDLV